MGPSLSILTTIILRYSFVQAYNEMMFTEPLIAAGESFTLTWTNSSSYIVNIWLFTVSRCQSTGFYLTVLPGRRGSQ